MPTLCLTIFEASFFFTLFIPWSLTPIVSHQSLRIHYLCSAPSPIDLVQTFLHFLCGIWQKPPDFSSYLPSASITYLFSTFPMVTSLEMASVNMSYSSLLLILLSDLITFRMKSNSLESPQNPSQVFPQCDLLFPTPDPIYSLSHHTEFL